MAAAAKKKEKAILAGLASVVGLDGNAPAAEVLQTVAETLGCVVADDGTTALAEEEEPALGARKRRRGGAANGSKQAAAEDEEEEEEEEEGEEGDSEDEEGSEGEGAPSPTSSGQPEGELEDEMEDFDLTLEPVEVEDPRTPDQVAPWASLPDGEAVFQWLISPVDTATFWEGVHEDAPLLVARPANRAYFEGLFSKDEMEKLLRRPGGLQYVYNVDVTSFSVGGRSRTNLNFNGDAEPAGEAAPETADPKVVWRRFGEGCSVRVLHPQRFCDSLWRLISRLESYLQCPVGCNSYLTPPGTQGFAPHWDDIDAFVLQLEGTKRWRVHAPTDPEHVLPRYSSRDFADEELGEVVMEVVLQPGDLLYLPRGCVHQAEALPDSHSLHITLSANQQRSWAVFLEEALPQALRDAAQANRDLRRALPRDTFEYMGMMHARDAGEDEEEEDVRRADFTRVCAELVETVMHHMPLDEVADQMAVQFLQQRLPPPPREGAAQPKGGAGAGGSGGLGKGAWVGLAQPGIARLVIDEEGPEPIAEVHHCCANRRDLHARKPADEQEALDEALEEVAVEAAGSLEFPLAAAELLDVLLRAGSGAPGAPEAVPVDELPAPVGEGEDAPSVESVVSSLLEAGVLEVKAAPQQ